MCESSVDKKLPIHFDEDKTKCILFSKGKNMTEHNIIYDNNRIKGFDIAEYLNCHLNTNLGNHSNHGNHTNHGNEISSMKYQFFYIQNEFLNPKLHLLLCCVTL